MADIELVIKMPKEYYENLLKNCRFSSEEIPVVSLAIAAGIPLPEGHGDLIDKRKFRKWIETQDGDKLMTEYYLDALDMQEAIVRSSHDRDID